MGYRLHARKINRIEYSDGVFNNMGDTIMPILHDFPGYHYSPESDDRIEIQRDDFKEGIEILKRTPTKEFNKLYRPPKDVTKKEIIKTLETLYEESDPENDYISLDWF